MNEQDELDLETPARLMEAAPSVLADYATRGDLEGAEAIVRAVFGVAE